MSLIYKRKVLAPNTPNAMFAIAELQSLIDTYYFPLLKQYFNQLFMTPLMTLCRS